MRRNALMQRWCPALAAVLLAALPGPLAYGQEDAPPADREERDQPEREQRSAYNFEDSDTSETNEQLENILTRFPDSDANKDGILDAEEGRKFIDEQRERWRGRRDSRRRRGKVQPTHANVAYGPDPKHVLDLYLAESEPDKPSPLVVFFHGGQFIAGDKSDTGTLDINALLKAGISVASIDYRAARYNPFPAPFEDAARAVQFLRLAAGRYNLDPERFGGHGEEAGGNIALYLALHDDLATRPPKAEDEKKAGDAESDDRGRADTDREGEDAGDDEDEEDGELWENPEIVAMSTRLSCAVARHPIASFDPRDWRRHKLPMNDHERLMRMYLDVRYLEPLEDPDVIALVEEVSPLALITRDDPELLLMSQYADIELKDDTTWTIVRHHPRQSELIAQEMRAKGNKATVRYRGMKNDPGTSSVQFFLDKLK